MTNNWEKLNNEILQTDLYSHSGTEVGISNNSLRLVEHDGNYIAVKQRDGDIPETVILGSPDRHAHYPDLNRFTFGSLPNSFLIGEYKKIYIGFHTDPTVRSNAASAGITSGIQLYLLEKKRADGVITMGMDKNRPYLTKPFIATNKEEVLSGAQSKYTTAPLNQILSNLPESYRSLVYTGLPHEIAAIRKLQQLEHPSVACIQYVLGIFYGETISFSAIQSLLRAHHVKNVDGIRSLAFRAGEWPGHMRIELKNGKVISVRKLHANYLIPSHITPFSLYQVDYMSELADISVGDAWAPSYEKRGEGWSVVVVRSDKGVALIEEMKRVKKLSLKEIDATELIDMHSHGLDLKKRGAFIRIERRRKRGLPVPEYGYRPTNIPKGRYVFESLLTVLFALFRFPVTIWILEKLPISFIGWFFIRARNAWKWATKSTKRGGLQKLEFEIHEAAKP